MELLQDVMDTKMFGQVKRTVKWKEVIKDVLKILSLPQEFLKSTLQEAGRVS